MPRGKSVRFGDQTDGKKINYCTEDQILPMHHMIYYTEVELSDGEPLSAMLIGATEEIVCSIKMRRKLLS